MATDFYEHEDKELSMRVPRYLRPKKGIRYFAAAGKQSKEPGIFAMAVDLPNAESAGAVRNNLLSVNPIDWQGVQQRVIRRGKPDYLHDGVELLSSSYNTVNSDVLYEYAVLFTAGGRNVYCSMSGRGE